MKTHNFVFLPNFFLYFMICSGIMNHLLFLFQIILSLLLPPAILLLEFKSKAEMCHVPQSHETPLFGIEPVKSLPVPKGSDQMVVCQLLDSSLSNVSSHDIISPLILAGQCGCRARPPVSG